jgi:hypothetical protein
MTLNLGASSAGGSTSGQLRPTGGYTTVTPLTINGASRQVTVPTQVIASINLDVADNGNRLVNVQISPDNATWDTIARVQHDFNVAGILGVTGDSNIETPVTFELPANWYYRLQGTSSGGGGWSNSLLKERAI